MIERNVEKEIGNNELLKLILMQFNNLHKYIIAKTDKERLKILEEKSNIREKVMNAIS